jgi:hypothetical protein
MPLRRLIATGAVLSSFLAGFVALGSAAHATTGTPILSSTVIGHSVRNRPIVAYHLGDPTSKKTALILGEMHGDEHAGVTIAQSLIHGPSAVEGINLWVIPTMNPDGFTANTRQNAHHVDLNRNWPDHWAHLTGLYYSGPKPLSEPETRAMYHFLLKVKPHYIVSLHQPLDGVDTTDGGGLDHAFRNRLARNLHLSEKAFRCWSFCHGSMTGWYTTHRYGIGETVEFGYHPSRAYLVGRARSGIIAALGGHFGSFSAHVPRSSLRAVLTSNRAHLTGWAYDVDARGSALKYSAWTDGKKVYSAWASKSDAALNRKYHLSGGHRFDIQLAITPGKRHTLCMVFANVGAGYPTVKRCITVRAPDEPVQDGAPTPAPDSNAVVRTAATSTSATGAGTTSNSDADHATAAHTPSAPRQ